jgi:hypothetical protein
MTIKRRGRYGSQTVGVGGSDHVQGIAIERAGRIVRRDTLGVPRDQTTEHCEQQHATTEVAEAVVRLSFEDRNRLQERRMRLRTMGPSHRIVAEPSGGPTSGIRQIEQTGPPSAERARRQEPQEMGGDAVQAIRAIKPTYRTAEATDSTTIINQVYRSISEEQHEQ